jgi:hypothetical protein
VSPQIDPLEGAGDRRRQRLDQIVVIGDKREDGTVVVCVRMNIEQARSSGEGASD